MSNATNEGAHQGLLLSSRECDRPSNFDHGPVQESSLPSSPSASCMSENLDLEVGEKDQETRGSNGAEKHLPEDIQKSQEKETMEATASGITKMDEFHQRMKSDLMYELRNIQHSEKPVTGQNRRENIQKFMEKYVGVEESTASARPSTSNEDHRPEAVVVEVQGVIEQRRVSSMLQSPAFRRQLENVIRGGIQSSQSTVTPTPRPRANRGLAASPAVPRLRTRATPPEDVTPAVHARQTIAPPHVERRTQPVQPRLTRSDSTESISSVDSFSSARSSVDTDIADIDEAVGTVEEPQQSRSRPNNSLQELPIHTPRLPQANAQDGSDTGVQNLRWNNITHIHQEELVEEISDLLHSRLVSSTLDGEFRATLEVLFQERVENSGTNGEAVQEFIQHLPRGGVVHNDFTHLGIPNTDVENLDNISVTSVSAHSVPYAQTNSHLSREIQSLKSQMLEMKNMMKLCFDMQMDIQRAVRQEVAAAMQSATGATAVPAKPTPPVDDTHCIICLDNHSDSVLYQCGHMCVCYTCGKNLVSRNLGCPVCRAPIKDVIRAYKTNTE